MDIAKTRADLVSRALDLLDVVGSGQAPETEDVEKCNGFVDGMLADLEAREIYAVQNEAEIDIAAFEWLAMILAEQSCSVAARDINPQKKLFAENMLKQQRGRPTYEVQKTEYF